MAYNIRSENQTLIATVENITAIEMISGAPGFFRTMKFNSGKEKVVYEITSDMKYTYNGIELYLWKGYILVPQ